ncbi:MAG TPA: CDP-archaeol synthase [Steroidobacteraceae bacterium]|nr:CDP-archaeol synthase [Steroidobacteraceae bacterium]
MSADALRALVLVITANSTPWLLARLFGSHWAVPLDFGCLLRDGQPLFGNHKTWRGVIGAVIATSIVGRMWGLGWVTGGAFGALALVGDALSSAIKRRLRFPPGTEIAVVDQAAEALLPMVLLARPLGLDLFSGAVAAAVFVILDLPGTMVRRGARALWQAVIHSNRGHGA